MTTPLLKLVPIGLNQERARANGLGEWRAVAIENALESRFLSDGDQLAIACNRNTGWNASGENYDCGASRSCAKRTVDLHPLLRRDGWARRIESKLAPLRRCDDDVGAGLLAQFDRTDDDATALQAVEEFFTART